MSAIPIDMGTETLTGDPGNPLKHVQLGGMKEGLVMRKGN